ncbi:hypothetical protein GLYMA_09G216400v4 [Glycine max]|uniref:non-specific serine/threonine protein kinase n=1 Tax=Glycine max TaxID=3847 RepID=K7LFA4_SOYBN|nr:hypothetical protein GYH30_025775 [Glycine max]KRH39725.1 hypothetical protein GLYMA_09G216400v4 [Glycine max]
MKYISLMLLAFWSINIHLFSLFTLNTLWFSSNMTVIASGNETDHLALFNFKKSISNDPYGILFSWNTSTHFCNWHGITCNLMLQRVTELNLDGYQLKGFISPHVGNLSYMRNLSLSNNNFHGKIPQELGRLSQLQHLSIENNSLGGEIPTNLTGCTHLNSLFSYGNNLIGKIPIEIVSLQKLQYLSISQNKLTGRIPSFIGNLSSLIVLGVGYNNLEGEIPQEICRLKSLKWLSTGINKLTGTFPSCLYNMSSLTVLAATENQLNGTLPPNMFHTLPNLRVFEIGGNKISGPIPPSITNTSILSILEIGGHFRGQVPSLGKLQNLQILNLSPNNLGNNSTNDLEFLNSLTNCSKLQVLSIAHNNFGGQLPNSLGNLSTQLSELALGGNQISGKIPTELGNLINLVLLGLEQSHFQGIIPSAFGKFQKLQLLELSANKLSGDLPAFLGNLSQLFHLGLGENKLEGNIPSSIGNCQMLQYLYLRQNNLRGTIPLEIFNLSSLTQVLDLSQNSLSGSIPKEVNNLKNINLLDVSENHLSGEIPGTIRECTMLEYLYLQGNSLQGIIPSSLASLKSLQRLDLSRNRLSGSIPNVLQNMSFLEYLNVSFNMLDGEVPTEGVFQNASGLVVTGNSKLCGGISKLHLPPCPVKGSGNFSFVYKGTIELEEKVAAIKVLKLQNKGAHKSFIVECNALKNIKHRNLVQILTCCSSTDYKGQEFKAIIFQYMTNGSLDQWLHPSTISAEHPRTLSLNQRLNIMIDVASALHYLHHECEQMIIHCDLKPSNVLLDDDMIAHVSDFGIARLISTSNGTNSEQASTIGIKGTIGYAPPEYGVGSEVSMNGDMYSFGILMLEMLTGRRPTDEIFEDGQNLRSFVENSFPGNLSQILDPSLVLKQGEAPIEEENNQNISPVVQKCLVTLFSIGLACSVESPKQRMNMVNVTKELNKTKRAFLTGVDA